MKNIVHYIGLAVDTETMGGWPGPERLVANEPIYSLRSPGFAGKCGRYFVPVTPGAARGLALPGATIFHPYGISKWPAGGFQTAGWN